MEILTCLKNIIKTIIIALRFDFKKIILRVLWGIDSNVKQIIKNA